MSSQPSKRAVLEDSSFGRRIAEEEVDELEHYFVETEDWRRIHSGEVDVVYGPKGSGKSAIYSLLVQRQSELFDDRSVLVIPAENPRGRPAFSDLQLDPPTSEREFVGLWKLYLLALIARVFRDYNLQSDKAQQVIGAVIEAGLIEGKGGFSLGRILRSAQEYVRRLINAEAVEAGVQVDPTGAVGVSGRILLGEPDSAQRSEGFMSVQTLFRLADEVLAEQTVSIWLVLDRLDVAFADTDELEKNALRALFRVYLDLTPYRWVALKIFLRSDIWRRIVDEGFREASHITRTVTIRWDDPSLLNLVIRRILRNEAIRNYYAVNEESVLGDIDHQEELFYRIFPQQVDRGEKKPTTFDWMLSRTQDGSQQTAPRELIHLLSSLRDQQLRRMEVGHEEPEEDYLFDRQTFKEALPDVSRARLQQTLYAEYPSLKAYLEKLEGEKTNHSVRTLAGIWALSEEEALEIATDLVEVGFFERRGSREDPDFWVPFLYRDALDLVQGSAE